MLRHKLPEVFFEMSYAVLPSPLFPLSLPFHTHGGSVGSYLEGLLYSATGLRLLRVSILFRISISELCIRGDHEWFTRSLPLLWGKLYFILGCHSIAKLLVLLLCAAFFFFFCLSGNIEVECAAVWSLFLWYIVCINFKVIMQM